MNQQTEPENHETSVPNRKRRNIILGLILAIAALSMYASIFLRLSENPLQ